MIPLIATLSAGKSLEELKYDAAKMTPSLRKGTIKSIRSPFYSHPHSITEIRRAQTPNNMSLHSLGSSNRNEE